MKAILAATAAMALATMVAPTAHADDCYWDGYELGEQESVAFCTVWEQMYNNDTIIYPYRSPGMQLCNNQLVLACKQGMAQHTRDNYPLCTWMIRNNWHNSDGESARTAWATWQRNACNVVLP
jgi:hypothetical protein